MKFKEFMKTHKLVVGVVAVALVGVITGSALYVTGKDKETPETEVVVVDTAEEATAPGIYETAGTFDEKDASFEEGTVMADGVTVKNAAFGDLAVDEAVGDGTVYLNGVTVTGTLTVNGGGEHSLHLEGCTVENIYSTDEDCHIDIDETTTCNVLTVPASALVNVNGTVESCYVYDNGVEVTDRLCGLCMADEASVGQVVVAESVNDTYAVTDAEGTEVASNVYVVNEEGKLATREVVAEQTKSGKSVAWSDDTASAKKTETTVKAESKSKSTTASSNSGSTSSAAASSNGGSTSTTGQINDQSGTVSQNSDGSYSSTDGSVYIGADPYAGNTGGSITVTPGGGIIGAGAGATPEEIQAFIDANNAATAYYGYDD